MTLNEKWYETAKERQTKARDHLLKGLKPVHAALEANAGNVMKLGMRATVHYTATLASMDRLIIYLENLSMHDGTLHAREMGLRRYGEKRKKK